MVSRRAPGLCRPSWARIFLRWGSYLDRDRFRWGGVRRCVLLELLRHVCTGISVYLLFLSGAGESLARIILEPFCEISIRRPGTGNKGLGQYAYRALGLNGLLRPLELASRILRWSFT